MWHPKRTLDSMRTGFCSLDPDALHFLRCTVFLCTNPQHIVKFAVARNGKVIRNERYKSGQSRELHFVIASIQSVNKLLK
jgi:hypothetical protein